MHNQMRLSTNRVGVPCDCPKKLAFGTVDSLIQSIFRISLRFAGGGGGGLCAIQIFVLARDQALFKTMFFAGDRAANLLEIKTSEILRFPDNSGFLFNHVWTKSLRSGDANVCAFRRGSNPNVCPVRGLELYLQPAGDSSRPRFPLSYCHQI